MGLLTNKKFLLGGLAVLVVVGVTVGVVVGTRDKTQNDDELAFPIEFKFGTASAAYQIEGASDVDGKGPNVWDDYTAKKMHIKDNSTGDDGPDSYYHYKEDVRIMKDVHMNFYRFSISWARVLPDGDISSKNEQGLQYYDDLIDELIANDIEPMITMYHWDLPSRINDLGGFTNPLFPKYFKEYARLLYSRYGDRVKQWITFNEPGVFCPNAYAGGGWAPGLKVDGGEYYCAHYMLIAHAEAYHLYYDEFINTQQGGGRVGITLDVGFQFPKDPDNPSDVEAAETAMQFGFGLYGHPIFIGNYPEVVRRNVDQFSANEGRAWSRLPEMDTATANRILGTSDFLGINYYTSRVVAYHDDWWAPNIWSDSRVQGDVDPSWPRAKSEWLYSVPEGLRSLLNWIKNNYNNVEVLITENGWSDDGEMDDLNRREYLRLHLDAVLKAIHEDDCKVTAHTTWSILDNFEWLQGFTEKFGIHSFDADSPTKTRTAKSSVEFLKQVIDERILPEKIPTELFP